MGGGAVNKIVVLALLTAGCTSTVVKDRPVEVKVPVTVPCVKDKPKEVQALRDQMTKERWASLATDQRQSLLLGQGLDHKAFGNKAMVVIAGCPE
jgi:hypothetical protein